MNCDTIPSRVSNKDVVCSAVLTIVGCGCFARQGCCGRFAPTRGCGVHCCDDPSYRCCLRCVSNKDVVCIAEWALPTRMWCALLSCVLAMLWLALLCLFHSGKCATRSSWGVLSSVDMSPTQRLVDCSCVFTRKFGQSQGCSNKGL